MADLGTLGGLQSVATAINNRGQIVGWSSVPPDDGSRAVLWEQGAIVDLGAPAISAWRPRSPSAARSSAGTGARSARVGRCRSSGTTAPRLTSARSAGPPPIRSRSNDRGQVVGGSETAEGEYHAFLWQDGVMTDLGTLGGPLSVALAINDGGQVIGYSVTASGDYHAFLWHDGVMTDLGAHSTPWTIGSALNEVGQGIGYTLTPTGEPQAVLWPWLGPVSAHSKRPIHP